MFCTSLSTHRVGLIQIEAIEIAMVSHVIDEFKISALFGSTERRVYTSTTILLDGFIVMWSKKYIIYNTSEFKLHLAYTNKCTCPIMQVHDLCLLKRLRLLCLLQLQLHAQLHEASLLWLYLQSTKATCSLLWLPVVNYGYVQSTMATCMLLSPLSIACLYVACYATQPTPVVARSIT